MRYVTRTAIKAEYFEWMCSLIYYKDFIKRNSYKKLLKYLNKIPFTYILEMDENRERDGISLRYYFGYDRGYTNSEIERYLDTEDGCSVLEMMVALANRCEKDIMRDYEIGDRTGKWFWDMIVNLRLGPMNDSHFDTDYIDEIMDIFLNREYGPNGEGALFTVNYTSRDFRNVEIWNQMLRYLDEYLDI